MLRSSEIVRRRFAATLFAAALGAWMPAEAVVAADPPGRRTPSSFEISFDGASISVSGLRPGTRTAWFGLIRERIDHHTRISRHRDIVVAGADGVARVQSAATDAVRSAWGVVDLDSGEYATFTSPGYDVWLSDSPPVTFASESVSVAFGYVEMMLVRTGSGAWSFSGIDGSATDGDASADGNVLVPLEQLRAIRGNAPPPAELDAADVLVLIDRSRMHVYAVRISEVR